MKFSPSKIAIASTLVVSSAAFAQAPAAAPSPLTFNINLTSNYKFRGQDQDTSRGSQIKPAIQGGFDYAFSNGFYVGNWNSNVSFVDPVDATRRANLEIDLYGGYKWSMGDFGFDVGLLQYYYPSTTKANTTEAYIGASYGPVSVKYSNTLSRGYFGTGINAAGTLSDGRGTQYLNIAFAKEILPNVTFKAAIGQTTFKNAVTSAGIPNFTDYSIGASYDFGDSLSLAGYVQGASQKTSYLLPAPNGTKSLNRDTFILTLTKAF